MYFISRASPVSPRHPAKRGICPNRLLPLSPYPPRRRAPYPRTHQISSCAARDSPPARPGGPRASRGRSPTLCPRTRCACHRPGRGSASGACPPPPRFRRGGGLEELIELLLLDPAEEMPVLADAMAGGQELRCVRPGERRDGEEALGLRRGVGQHRLEVNRQQA